MTARATVEFFCCSCGKVTKITTKTKNYDKLYDNWMCCKCNEHVEKEMRTRPV